MRMLIIKIYIYTHTYWYCKIWISCYVVGGSFDLYCNLHSGGKKYTNIRNMIYVLDMTIYNFFFFSFPSFYYVNLNFELKATPRLSHDAKPVNFLQWYLLKSQRAAFMSCQYLCFSSNLSVCLSLSLSICRRVQTTHSFLVILASCDNWRVIIDNNNSDFLQARRTYKHPPTQNTWINIKWLCASKIER